MKAGLNAKPILSKGVPEATKRAFKGIFLPTDLRQNSPEWGLGETRRFSTILDVALINLMCSLRV